MKSYLSRTEAKKKIDSFFTEKNFSAEEAKKIKRLAMKYNIKLGTYKRQFCKKCFLKLKGKIRITKTSKIIVCDNCGFVNRVRLS